MSLRSHPSLPSETTLHAGLHQSGQHEPFITIKTIRVEGVPIVKIPRSFVTLKFNHKKYETPRLDPRYATTHQWSDVRFHIWSQSDASEPIVIKYRCPALCGLLTNTFGTSEARLYELIRLGQNGHHQIKLPMNVKESANSCFLTLELANFSTSPLPSPLPKNPSDRAVRRSRGSMPSSSKGSSFWRVDGRARASPTSPTASDRNMSVLGPPLLSRPLPRVVTQTSRSVPQAGTLRSCPAASRSVPELSAPPFQPEDAPDPFGLEPEPQVSPRLAENLVTRGARMEGITSSAKDLASPVLGVLKSIEPVAEALHRLSRIHPIAELAMLTIFAVFKLVKAQYESDCAIVALHNAVVNTYEIAIKNEALSKDSRFVALFHTMVRQADECYLFISEYRSRRYFARLARINVSRKIQEFMEAFTQLERQFRGAEIDFTAVSLLKMRPVIETLDLKNRLERLKPPMDALGPLSHCLPGTRTQSFQSIRDWIFQGEESILWINGPAGSGKSSLMGTLHNRLLEMGFNSRLATFIRFDRDAYKDARMFVRTLAYRLALFDSRLGETIAERVAAQPQIVDGTDLFSQLRSLVLHPLQQHDKAMQTEGPIVILIDGLDECSRSDGTGTSFREQLLALFQSNNLGAFPFLRIVIASRPVQDIKAKFTGKSHILSFPLDITSADNRADVKSFIDTKLQEISDHTPGFGDLCRLHNAVEELSKRAAGLFMWASVAVSFLESYSRSRLKAIVKTDIPKT
ncbi:hypothetical protein PQX77_010437, partial [Marasmius sp. AFHP31]